MERPCNTCLNLPICKYAEDAEKLADAISAVSLNQEVDFFNITFSCTHNQKNIIYRG